MMIGDRWASAGQGAQARGWVLAWLLVIAPGISEACAVCTAGRDEENQLAFLLSTIGMSLMPLIAIGTLVFVIWRRIRKLEAAENLAPRADTGRPTTSVRTTSLPTRP